MYSTKNIVTRIDEVPEEWVFSFYLRLNKPMDGRSIYLKSPFSKTDTRPSFALYYKNGKYKFNDFSEGVSGSAVDLVMKLHKLSYVDAVKKILQDYEENPSFVIPEVKEKKEWNIRLEDVETRKWNSLDAEHWLSYKIGSNILESFNVKPIEYLAIYIYNELYEFSGDYTYGYFDRDGNLCKVYRPKEKIMRFIRIMDYLQGSDQVNKSYPLILIQSSLKDIMAMQSLGLKVNGIAPEGESTLLDASDVNHYVNEGFKLATLFDGDIAGIKGMLKYKETYGIPYVYVPKKSDKDKDIAEIRKNFSKRRALEIIVPRINKIYNDS